MLPDVVKILIPAALSFAIGIVITPFVTHFLYKYKAWKKKPGKTALDGTEAVEFNKLKLEGERKVPDRKSVV